MNNITKVLNAIKNSSEYTLQDLFRIRDALMVLREYDLVDLDLLLEVMKFINDKGEKNA